MADLRVDTDSLRDLGDELSQISTEFEAANTRSDTIAAAVGHSGLSDAITEFAHGWDDRRGEMLESITFMSEAAKGIADAVDQTDHDLGAALTCPAVPTPPVLGPPAPAFGPPAPVFGPPSPGFAP